MSTFISTFKPASTLHALAPLFLILMFTGCDQADVSPENKVQPFGQGEKISGTIYVQVAEVQDEFHLMVGAQTEDSPIAHHVFRLQLPADPRPRLQTGAFEGTLFYEVDQHDQYSVVDLPPRVKLVYVDVPGNRFALAVSPEHDVKAPPERIIYGIGLAHFEGDFPISASKNSSLAFDMAAICNATPASPSLHADDCSSGGVGATSCSVGGCNPVGASCNVTCSDGYYACCHCGGCKCKSSGGST